MNRPKPLDQTQVYERRYYSQGKGSELTIDSIRRSSVGLHKIAIDFLPSFDRPERNQSGVEVERGQSLLLTQYGRVW